MKQYWIIAAVFVLCTCKEEITPEIYQDQQAEAEFQRFVDSTFNARMEYFIPLFGDTTTLEAYYGTTLDSLRLQFEEWCRDPETLEKIKNNELPEF